MRGGERQWSMCVCEKEGNSHHSRVQDLSHSSGDHNLCGLRACRDEMRWDEMGWDGMRQKKKTI